MCAHECCSMFSVTTCSSFTHKEVQRTSRVMRDRKSMPLCSSSTDSGASELALSTCFTRFICRGAGMHAVALVAQAPQSGAA